MIVLDGDSGPPTLITTGHDDDQTILEMFWKERRRGRKLSLYLIHRVIECARLKFHIAMAVSSMELPVGVTI